MPFLLITDGSNSFMVNPKESISLELKLNVTEYGHTWKHIGDVLYNFGVDRLNQASFSVDPEQYVFLVKLTTMPDTGSCRGMR